MAKVTSPLLSLGGSGTIAGALTFSKWKGRPYVRQTVTPANPNTTGQQSTRNAFANGGEIWKIAGSLVTAPWDAFASGQVLTGRNAFMGAFVRDNRGQADLSNLVLSPGAKGGPPPASIGLTPGSGEIAVAFTNPTPPTGWTITAAVAAAILDQDPEAMTDFATVADDDTSTFNAVTLTGLTPSVLYQVCGWLVWTKPDGTLAYSASLIDSATPTV